MLLSQSLKGFFLFLHLILVKWPSILYSYFRMFKMFHVWFEDLIIDCAGRRMIKKRERSPVIQPKPFQEQGLLCCARSKYVLQIFASTWNYQGKCVCILYPSNVLKLHFEKSEWSVVTVVWFLVGAVSFSTPTPPPTPHPAARYLKLVVKL